MGWFPCHMRNRMLPASIGRAVVLGFCLINPLRLAGAAPDPAQTPPVPPQSPGGEAGVPEPEINVKKLFAGQCGWCHADYGMKAGKAVQLAGTSMTEKQVYDRIRNGKTDAMPAFRKTLTDEQIQAFVKYIKGLKAPA